MSAILITEDILSAADFSSATEQEGEYWEQPVPNSANTGKFRPQVDGTPADFSYSGSTTSVGTTTDVIDSVLALYGDDYFIGAILSGAVWKQDYSHADYVEVDVGANRLAETSATVLTITTLDDDEDVYEYRDFGASHFAGDFEIRFKLNVTAINYDAGIMGLANALGTINDITVVNGPFIGMKMTAFGGSYKAYVTEYVAGAENAGNQITLNLATDYYIKFKRDESVGANGTLYAYIYSDSGFETLVGTSSVALSNNTDFRYLYPMIAYNSGASGKSISFTISNFNIHDAATYTVADFTQSTGTLIFGAIEKSYSAVASTFTLTLHYETRDFAVELVAGGDAGTATFKWSHDGGTTYLGRTSPETPTWDGPRTIYTGTATTGINQIVSKAGTLYAFYNETDGGIIKAHLIKSTDGGLTWGSAVHATSGYSDGGAAIHTAFFDGERLMLFTKTGTGALDRTYSDDYGVTWSSTATVESTNTASGKVIKLLSGNYLFVYCKVGASKVCCKVSTDKGATWGAEIDVVAASVETSQGCSVCQCDTGEIVCVYNTDVDSGGDYEIKGKRSTDGGATWGSAIAVHNFVTDCLYPDIIQDITGYLYCIAVRGTTIYFVQSTDKGATWGAADTVVAAAVNLSDSPRLCMIDGHAIWCIYEDNTNNDVKAVSSGTWRGNIAYYPPCAINALPQHLACGAELTWYGGGGVAADDWTFDAHYYYGMDNIIADSPSMPFRSTQDNIACNIVIDLGTNERFYASGVAFFGCNIRTLSFQMNDTDSWGAPSLDSSVSFDLTTGGVVDAVSGNIISDTSLMASYKDHQLADGNYYVRMTSGTDSGVTWKIKDNIGDYIILDTTAATNIAQTDTFCIFQSFIAKTFTANVRRFIRISISAQQTAENYYQIGTMVVGKATTLTKGWAVGYAVDHVYDIDVQRTPKGGMTPIRGASRKRSWELKWSVATEAVRNEVASLVDHAYGKNIALIPDSTVLTECYLTKMVESYTRRHRAKTYFDVPIVLEEVL